MVAGQSHMGEYRDDPNRPGEGRDGHLTRRGWRDDGFLPASRKAFGRLTSFGLSLTGLAIMLAVALSDSPAGFREPASAAEVATPPAAALNQPPTAAPLAPGSPMIVPEVPPGAARTGLLVMALKAPVRRGDTLVVVLKRAGVANAEAHLAVDAIKDHFNLRKLQVGQDIKLELAKAAGGRSELQKLVIRTAFDQEVVVARGEDGRFSAERLQIPTVEATMYHRGTIDDSLYLAAEAADVPAIVIVEMIRLFSFEVDFQREIRAGDGFEVYYRRRIADNGRAVENREILYAALTLRGKPLAYFRFNDLSRGKVEYFDPSGKSAKRALMKTPIDGARLSSRYGRRRHPILGYTRMHKGADFAAGRGTPIMAAGDGVIQRASRYGGYGNYVRIRHNSSYSTAYAHLSRYGRGIRKGKRVKQGQIIGYVGATGLARGAHLHYEVLFNGKQVNPMTLKIPEGRKLEGDPLRLFQTLRTGLESDLASVRTLETLRAGVDIAPAKDAAQPGS